MAFVLTRMFPRNKKHVIQHRKNQFEIVFMYSLQIRPCNHHIHIHHDDWNSKEKECNDDREAWLWLQSLLFWQYKKEYLWKYTNATILSNCNFKDFHTSVFVYILYVTYNAFFIHKNLIKWINVTVLVYSLHRGTIVTRKIYLQCIINQCKHLIVMRVYMSQQHNEYLIMIFSVLLKLHKYKNTFFK